MSFYFFLVLLFCVAFLYASVGHGGASGYLALMVLFSFPQEKMRMTALILNIVVAAIAFLQYYRKVVFPWKLFLLLATTSIPAAFLGGMTSLDGHIYKKILGLILIFPIIKLVFLRYEEVEKLKVYHPLQLILTGGIIGYISGLIGIGGGILLTPWLLLNRWTTIKEAAIVSALFISVNSLAGLAGIAILGKNWEGDMLLFVAIAAIGGCIGAYWGANKFQNQHLSLALALALTIASLKLLFT